MTEKEIAELNRLFKRHDNMISMVFMIAILSAIIGLTNWAYTSNWFKGTLTFLQSRKN